MNKIIILLLLLTIGFLSCENSEKKIDKLKIARQYFKALNNSNSSEMKILLTDSLSTIIPEYDYEIKYSQEDYVGKWLKWDSVFTPVYKILDIELKNGVVKAKISKNDIRISFLMEEAFITNETLKFKNDKINRIETEYENFDEVIWERNKNKLLIWTEENHPELRLNRFIYDQTEYGGKKLLKAIELYKDKE